MSSLASPQARAAKAAIWGEALSTYSPDWRHASTSSAVMEATIADSPSPCPLPLRGRGKHCQPLSPPGARETLRAPLPRIGRGEGEGGVVQGHARRIGRRKVKVEPAPSALVTQILPPCSSMNFRHRVSPRPVPCCLAALEPT